MEKKTFTSFRDVIAVFGSTTAAAIRELSALLGEREKTVEMWHFRRSIPPDYYADIARIMASETDYEISIEELLALRQARFRSQAAAHKKAPQASAA